MGCVADADADPPHHRDLVGVAWRVGVVVLLLGAAGIAFGALTLRLQEHYRAAQAAGESLGTFTGLRADGSGPRTVWIGYAAALFFIGALLRLRLGPVEPPVGGPRRTAAEMRAAFRAEHHTVRVALVVVIVVAGLDTGRAVVYAGAAVAGRAAARSDAGWVVAEGVGVLLAAATLLAWSRVFRTQLERVGAI